MLFPKWVPGNHAPAARVERLAGLVVAAKGRRLSWTRDPVDMHAFHIEVPTGVRQLAIQFQYLSATGPDGCVVMTPELLNLQWFSVLLYRPAVSRASVGDLHGSMCHRQLVERPR